MLTMKIDWELGKMAEQQVFKIKMLSPNVKPKCCAITKTKATTFVFLLRLNMVV